MRRLAVALALLLAVSACEDDFLQVRLGAQTEPFLGCHPEGIIGTNTSVDGSLTTGDCTLEGRFADLYELRLSALTTLMFDLRSLEFRPAMALIDRATGQLVVSEEAPFFSGTVAFTAPVPAGTYLIVATSALANQTGSYRLSVSTGF